jgi:hypothetical protein
MIRLLQFGAVNLPYLNATSGLALEGRASIQETRGGGFDSDGQKLYLKPATITLSADVLEEDSTIDAQLDALFSELNKGRLVCQGETRSEVRRYTWIKLASGQRNWGVGQAAYQQLALTFNQIYPYWLAWDDAPPFADIGYVADAGLTADGQYEETSLTTTSTTFDIDNTGGAEIDRGEFRIEVQAASQIVNPGIVNDTLGMEFRYGGTLTAGDILVIDWLTRSCRLNGEDAYANLYVSDRHNWMQLQLDTNDFTFRGDSVTGTIKLFTLWQRHYI